MLTIDDALLARAGLGDLPAGARDAYREALHERLELAVGTRLADRMSDEQLDEFERLTDGPEAYALAWLHVNFPDYRRIVREELERLTRDLARQAGAILSLEQGFAGS